MNQILRQVFNAGRTVESVLGDWMMNVNTRGGVKFCNDRGKYQDALDFETVAHTAMRKAIRLVMPSPEDVVFDIGCGKGRALCHFARLRVRKVVGVELSEALCQAARENAKRLRRARSPIEIFQGDAAEVDLSEGTYFFMNNPFGEKTLRDVLRNIEISHDLATTLVTIIYMTARYPHVINEFPWLKVIFDYRRARGGRVMIYQSDLSTRW